MGGLFVFLLGLGGPALVRKYDAWKAADAAERHALEDERKARMDDFISSNAVVPGMVPEQVRRAIGPPRSIKATGDGAVQRWFYLKQVVVFEQGKVIGVEALPPADAKGKSP